MQRVIPSLLICLLLPACTVGIMRVDGTPAPGITLTLSLAPAGDGAPVSTSTEVASTTPTPLAPTPTPLPTRTLAPVPAPSTTPTPTAAPPASVSAFGIKSFTVGVEEIASGKRITFDWETSGASEAVILGGLALRFPPSWAVSPSGTLTVELANTLFPDPTMTLIVRDELGNEAVEAITIPWPCQYAYFFAPAADDCPGLGACYCPLYEATYTSAAEQQFEYGRMIWLRQLRVQDGVIERQILVLYDDGRGEHYDDTWTPEEPESELIMVPPQGRYQPVRGFGKLWLEEPGVRTRLGWGLAPEQAFEAAWQQQITESIPGVVYVRRLDGQVIKFTGWGMVSGSWQRVSQTYGE